MTQLSEALKRCRVEKGLTQKQVADALHIKVQAYQRWEYGTIVPSATFIISLADFYGVSTDYLLGRSDHP